MKQIFSYIDVVQKFLEVLMWKFLIILSNQIRTLFPCNLSITYFLRRIISRTANTKLNECGEVVEHVYSVINATVLGVRALSPIAIRLEAGIFDRVVITLLRIPL